MADEERARKHGWVPLDEFRGDPDKWVDAETFLDRGDNMLPIMKERFGKLEEKFEASQQREKELSSKLDKLTDNLKNFAEFHKGTAKRSYERAIRDLKGQQRAAVESGDIGAFDRIDQEITELNSEITGNTVDDSPNITDDVNPDFIPWQKENIWYGTDGDLTAFANGIGPVIAKENPNISGKDLYEEVSKRVKKAFPGKFKTVTTPDPVESGNTDVTIVKKGKTWSDIPKSDREEFTKSFGEIPGYSKEDYAKDYWAQFEG